MSDFNKVIAHNSFAVPIITPTIEKIEWTIDEIRQIDINTRKLLTMTRSFHPNSDVDRIYMSRAKGGRGLRSIRTLYESRIISLRQHLLRNANRNDILGYVRECEQAYIMQKSLTADSCLNHLRGVSSELFEWVLNTLILNLKMFYRC